MYQLDDDHQFNLLDSRSNKRSIAVRLPDALQYMEDLSEDAVVVSPGENKRTLTRPLSLSLSRPTDLRNDPQSFYSGFHCHP